MRSVALALACAVLAIAPCVRAQHAELVMPACTPPWWDEVGLRDAVDVELRGASARIELDVAAPCEDAVVVVAHVLDGDGASTRRIELADVPPPMRARAIAMALASVLAEPRASVEPPHADVPAATASRARDELGAPVASDPVIAEVAPDASVGLVLAGVAALAPASPSVWGGPRAGVVARIAPPLHLVAGLEALFTTRSDPLGEVRGTWIHGAIGAGLEASLAPLRLGGSLALGLGWAQLEGETSSSDVVARRSDGAIVTFDVALRGALDLDRAIAIVLGIEARLVALGLEARSPSGAVLALRDAVLAAQLGIELRL
ncbi:hypothetical protein [Sandaracinus amylolyticus]|uniref:Flagellar hook-length control protein FliK n=1 Tax=Sandaracinus amylolyticus TaxID=927083 RepID=A0A0F6YL34_9BACT|nr:hypothetical protein [Sandaracinus amylolyticus]AKF09397.1 hypothetical protein DB32_006546 [Sandaracinus amylolyticus]